SASTVTTGTDGRAATVGIVGTTAGVNRVEARVAGLTPVIFTATGNADRATARLIPVSGNNQVGRRGQARPEPLVVRLEDRFRNPLPGETVTGTIIEGGATLLPVSAPAQAEGSTALTVATDLTGTAAFRLIAGPSEGTIVTEAKTPNLPAVPPVQ